MRLTSIELSGFRAFSRQEHFDLDADAVLVLGANGQGKTSLFDGVLWALTGSISRFSSPESVLSMWSSSGQAYVELGLAGDGGAFTLVRTFDGKSTSLALSRRSGGVVMAGRIPSVENPGVAGVVRGPLGWRRRGDRVRGPAAPRAGAWVRACRGVRRWRPG